MELANFASLTPSQQEQVLDSPALPPPAGVQPNFDHPPNQNHIVYPTLISALILSFSFVLLRIHSRWYCLKIVKCQDVLGIMALILFIAELAIYFEEMPQHNARGLFVHQWDLRVRDLRPFFLRATIIVHLYAGMMILLKTAILIDWRQIFSPPGKRGVFYWACTITIAINAIFWVTAIVIQDLQCVPHEAIYDKTVPGRCIGNPKILDVLTSAFNFTVDVIILVLPQGVIWKLNMTTMKQLGVSIVFAAGSLACLSAGVRLGFTIIYLNSDDITYPYSSAGLLTVAEVTCGFIVFCVPSAPKSIASFKDSKFIQRLKSRHNSKTGGPSGHGSYQSRWKPIPSSCPKGDEYSEIDAHYWNCIP